MDEIQALRSMRDDVEPPAPLRLAGLRAGLFRSMSTPPRRRVPKLAWRLAMAGGLAVAILAGITVAQGNGVLRPEPASAAVFLEKAASTLAAQPSREERPRDDQWLYTKVLRTSITIPANVDDMTGRPPATDGSTTDTREIWFRFDGKKIAGQVSPIGLPCYDERFPARVWELRASLPHDPDQLLAAVHEEVKRICPNESHDGQGLNNRTVWFIGVLLGDVTGMVPAPDLQAALYRALAKVQGVTATEGVTDLAGREGVLLSHRWEGYSVGIVVDPESYALLGTSQKVEDGKVVRGSSLLKSGIVDEPGERP